MLRMLITISLGFWERTEISRYYSLRWKAYSWCQYKVQFVVQPLIVLALYCSVFYCICSSFWFHVNAYKVWRALCFNVVIYKRWARASPLQQLSPQTLPLHMPEFGLLNVRLGKQCALSVKICNVNHLQTYANTGDYINIFLNMRFVHRDFKIKVALTVRLC